MIRESPSKVGFLKLCQKDDFLQKKMHFATSKISLESGRSLSVSGLKRLIKQSPVCIYIRVIGLIS